MCQSPIIGIFYSHAIYAIYAIYPALYEYLKVEGNEKLMKLNGENVGHKVRPFMRMC